LHVNRAETTGLMKTMDKAALLDRPGHKGQSVVDYLRAAIRNGRFAPGQRLIEAELTEELGVSRGPVREAFRRLSAEGLIEIVPNRGALVRRLSVTEALELFEIRTELEALAARRAAVNMSDPCIKARFEQEIAPIWDDEPRYSTSDYIAENQHFHSAIITAAGNGQLIKLNHQLQLSLIMAQISSALTSEVIAASLGEHRAIAGAILAGDAAAADAATRDHHQRAMHFMRSMPADVFRRSA
jgi:DNA-binding GntR family transcriptional regulator